MRSPDRGHTSCLPSEIFCDRFNYITQIMSKYSDLFPWYLLSLESSVNSENTAARGQTNQVPLHSTITHFPDARDRKLRITPYKKSCKIGMTKPSGHRDDEAVQFADDAPPLVTTVSWQGASTLRSSRNSFFEKNTHFHPNSWTAWISEFRCTGKKSKAIFDPANSGLSFPLRHWIKKAGSVFWCRKQCEFLFRQFSHKIITKHSPFFVSSFPMQLQTHNNQLKKRKEIKAICGEWFFCCCQLLTAKIGQQRKEESDFLTGKEDHGSCLDETALNNTTINQ